jgi:hypothetical protein
MLKPFLRQVNPVPAFRFPRWLFVLALGACPLLAAPIFHVSPEGDDSWSGTQPKPTLLRRDGPFRTIERARQAVRETGDTAGVRVILAAGEYLLPEGIVFGPEDLGTLSSPVVYEAAPDALVVLRGDRPLANWRRETEDILSADLPAGGQPALFAEDRPLPSARFPNLSASHPYSGGFGYVVRSEAVGGTLFLPVSGAQGLAAASWERLAGTKIWIWPEDGSRRQTVVTAANRERSTLCVPEQTGILPGTRFVLVGLPDELDAPGEWLPGPEPGRVRLVPPEELEPEQGVTVSTASVLISVRGRPDEPLRGVQFIGIDFRGAAGDLAQVADAACVFTRCAFLAAGGDGIRAERAGLHVEGCDFRHLGGAAVHLNATRDAVVHNCWIAETGSLLDRPAAIVAADDACANLRIGRNLVHDQPASGIFLRGGGHSCTGNWLHHLGLERAGGGGILLSGGGEAEPSVARGNLVADSGGYQRLDGFRYAFPAGSAGIDVRNGDGSEVVENLLVRCPVGVRVAGRSQKVENNLFVGEGEAHVRLGAATALAVRRNVAFSHAGATAWLGGDRLAERLAEVDWNLLWYEERDPFVRQGGAEMAWGSWQALGFDLRSVLADPMFRAPELDEFSLLPQSFAFKLGFVPLPADQAGCYESPARRTWPIDDELWREQHLLVLPVQAR